MQHAAELDGDLIMQGRRLLDLSAVEVLNICYRQITRDLPDDKRKKIDQQLKKAWKKVEDPRLPERLRNMKAPPWFDATQDPWAQTITVGGRG